MNLVKNVDHYTSSCGYCSCGDSAAMGMWAHKLSCEAYQDLLDRGWRRSGQWVYRPLPDKEAACRCHPYTVRLDANKFQPSRDQRKVLRRFDAFLEGRRCEPRGLPVQQGRGVAGAHLTHAQPEAVALQQEGSLSEQQWLAEDRKRKSHLISPSPIASPTGHHSLADEASETLASPELAAMMSAEFSSPALSSTQGAACPAGMECNGVSLSREALVPPCSTCDSRHARGRCPGQASGCSTPVGSEESAHSAVATRVIDQDWPGHVVGQSKQALNVPDSALRQPTRSQSLAGMVESAVQQAVQRLMLRGQLPVMPCPALLVKVPSWKQQKVSCGNIVLTSPAPHALAAAARREQGGSSVPAASVAEALARQIAAGAAVLRDDAGCRLAARAEAGHLNFFRQGSLPPAGPDTSPPASHSPPDVGQPSHHSAEGMRIAIESSKVLMSSAPTGVPIPESEQHQSSQHLWSIPARFTGQSARRASNTGSPAQADAHVYVQAYSSCGDAKQCYLPVDMDSSVEGAQTQSPQSQQPGGLRGQRRAMARRGRAQASAEHGAKAAAQLRTLNIRTLPADSDLVPVEFPLYRKYQIRHHGEDPGEVTEATFRRFLVDSPLVPSTSADGVRFGSFHQQYWVDGELVAVGVVDVLPRCLSSAYLFWDPDWASMGLGKLTALKEIAWVQAASARCPALQWYHMGYFLETCPKMRYKADFHPSELLCMRTYAWVPLSIALPALKADSHCAVGLLAGREGLANATKDESSLNGGDALVYCGQPDGQRQLLRLRELPDTVDGVAQEMNLLLRAKLRVWQQLGGPTMTTFIVII